MRELSFEETAAVSGAGPSTLTEEDDGTFVFALGSDDRRAQLTAALPPFDYSRLGFGGTGFGGGSSRAPFRGVPYADVIADAPELLPPPEFVPLEVPPFIPATEAEIDAARDREIAELQRQMAEQQAIEARRAAEEQRRAEQELAREVCLEAYAAGGALMGASLGNAENNSAALYGFVGAVIGAGVGQVVCPR